MFLFFIMWGQLVYIVTKIKLNFTFADQQKKGAPKWLVFDPKYIFF